MLRTVGVFIAGRLLATALVGANVYIAAYVIPERFDRYLYVVFVVLVGLVVGLAVLERYKGTKLVRSR
jgi:hypothetical protein